MSDGHPLRDLHLREVTNWPAVEGTPEKNKVGVGCAVGAAGIETYGFIGSRGPEGI